MFDKKIIIVDRSSHKCSNCGIETNYFVTENDRTGTSEDLSTSYYYNKIICKNCKQENGTITMIQNLQ